MDHARLPAWLLLATVFVTGASVLVIELIGTRVLAPFFGSGIYTWSALIAVTLAALALGYSLGGRLADRSPNPTILFYLCLLAGVWTVVTPWLGTLVLPNLAQAAEIRIVVLASSVLLFFPNLFVLGMACPFAIRLFSSDREASGRTSGRVFAVSTLGSLLAALLTGFFLVPNFGVLSILTFCGTVLIGLSGFGFLFLKFFPTAFLGLVLACLAILGTLSPPRAEHDTLELVDSSPSFYGHVQVINRYGLKLLLVNGIMQNLAMGDGQGELSYLAFFSALPLIRDIPSNRHPNGLVVGLGAGQLPVMLERNGVAVEAVEIDPVIDTMARRHFELDIGSDQVHFTDGRLFLETTENRYDYIFLDAYNADQVPWHLLSREALERARSRLQEGGLVVVNTVSLPRSDEVAAVNQTLKSVFPHVRVFNELLDANLSNIVFLASASPIELIPFANDLAEDDADNVMRYLAGEIHDLPAGLVLSDDYNPINHLHEAAQVQWRRDMRTFLGKDYYDWAFY